MRSGIVHDDAVRRGWVRDHCQICGIHEHAAPYVNGRSLHTHHLCRGAARSDELTNFLKACMRCHELVHGASIRVRGERIPSISFGQTLTIKKVRDPIEFDHDRLAEIYGEGLPPLEFPWECYEKEYVSRRPMPFRPYSGLFKNSLVQREIDWQSWKVRCSRCIRTGRLDTRGECGACRELNS